MRAAAAEGRGFPWPRLAGRGRPAAGVGCARAARAGGRRPSVGCTRQRASCGVVHRDAAGPWGSPRPADRRHTPIRFLAGIGTTSAKSLQGACGAAFTRVRTPPAACCLWRTSHERRRSIGEGPVSGSHTLTACCAPHMNVPRTPLAAPAPFTARSLSVIAFGGARASAPRVAVVTICPESSRFAGFWRLEDGWTLFCGPRQLTEMGCPPAVLCAATGRGRTRVAAMRRPSGPQPAIGGSL